MHKKLFLDNHYHFIGIGGIGMSAIASALIKKGYSVSGSDLVRNKETEALESLGVIIFYSQLKNNIDYLCMEFKNKQINCIYSSAIKKENEELSYCKNKKFPIKHRSEMLAMIMKSYISLAITGTHGKTSTCTFLSTLMELCTHNSSSITGGIMPIYESNAYIDDTKFLVTEIDESDGTIDQYNSDIGIINNIDFDHCDHFSSINELISSFEGFAAKSKELLVNYDCQVTRKIFTSAKKWSNKELKNISYSIIPNQLNKTSTIGKYYEDGNFIDTLEIPVPGLHNLSNVTASIAASRMIGINIKDIKKNIRYLKLPKKRFELRGEFDGRIFYDDYAHHPNEIKATIQLGRLFLKDTNKVGEKHRLVIIFQPHRFSRVKQFVNEFAEELSKADVIYITDIFGAGEENKHKINSELITNIINQKNKNVRYIRNYNEIENNFHKLTNHNDLIINMGAGDSYNFWAKLNKKNK